MTSVPSAWLSGLFLNAGDLQSLSWRFLWTSPISTCRWIEDAGHQNDQSNHNRHSYHHVPYLTFPGRPVSAFACSYVLGTARHRAV